jgi:hypothetical protein
MATAPVSRKLNLTRDQLAEFLTDQQQIRQFELLFSTVDAIAPDVVNEVKIEAGSAQATANEALAALSALSQALELVTLSPRPELGTIASQNSDNVNITGGKISGLNPALPVDSGGTGQSTFTNGELLIGNTTGNTLAKATLTAGANITITNGTGSITIAVSGLGTMAFENIGASGSFVTADIPPQTVTVVNGIITSIV